MVGKGRVQGRPHLVGKGRVQGRPHKVGKGRVQGRPHMVGKGRVQGRPHMVGKGRVQGRPHMVGKGRVQGRPHMVGKGRVQGRPYMVGKGRVQGRPDRAGARGTHLLTMREASAHQEGFVPPLAGVDGSSTTRGVSGRVPNKSGVSQAISERGGSGIEGEWDSTSQGTNGGCPIKVRSSPSRVLPLGVFTLSDARSFSGLTSKIPPLSSMLNFDTDVKNSTARHQCENRYSEVNSSVLVSCCDNRRVNVQQSNWWRFTKGEGLAPHGNMGEEHAQVSNLNLATRSHPSQPESEQQVALD